MNVQVHHVVVHSPEQTTSIIEEAERIADGAQARGYPWETAFREATRLLGQRYTLAIPQEQMPVSLPAMAIPRGRH